MPFSICLNIFSNTTIASSTTKPIASTKANIVRVLTVKPNKAIKAKVPIKQTGIVTNGMMDARKVLRKRKITKATNTIASTMVSYTALIDRSINTELSLATSISIPDGKFSLIFGIIWRTAALRSSGLAVALRITPRVMASRPFRRVDVRSDKGPCSTRATSPIRIGMPLMALITTCLNSAGFCKSVAAVTLNSRNLLSIRPAGTSTLERRNASSTSCVVNL